MSRETSVHSSVYWCDYCTDPKTGHMAIDDEEEGCPGYHVQVEICADCLERFAREIREKMAEDMAQAEREEKGGGK